MSRFAVIMAGGRGERFWPESRTEKPKQFLTLVGERSLLQQSYDRIKDLFPAEKVFVVVNQQHLELAREHLFELPSENFLVEPAGRNTAPCIGLAAVHIRQRDYEASMLVLPADHMIQGKRDFVDCLEKGFAWAEKEDSLVTIGINPTRPETGYGYIEREEEEKDKDPAVFSVRRFVEKPDVKRAKEFVRTGRYYWNSGIFIWKASVILKEIENHIPELSQGLKTIEKACNTPQAQKIMSEVFPGLPRISIDYGVMEKVSKIFMVQGDFGWDDLGSWGALASLSEKDADGMVVKGPFVGVDNADCFVYSKDALIAALGVQDLIIVQSDDVFLVCHKERTQEVKELVQMLKEKEMEKYL